MPWDQLLLFCDYKNKISFYILNEKDFINILLIIITKFCYISFF